MMGFQKNTIDYYKFYANIVNIENVNIRSIRNLFTYNIAILCKSN